METEDIFESEKLNALFRTRYELGDYYPWVVPMVLSILDELANYKHYDGMYCSEFLLLGSPHTYISMTTYDIRDEIRDTIVDLGQLVGVIFISEARVMYAELMTNGRLIEASSGPDNPLFGVIAHELCHLCDPTPWAGINQGKYKHESWDDYNNRLHGERYRRLARWLERRFKTKSIITQPENDMPMEIQGFYPFCSLMKDPKWTDQIDDFFKPTQIVET